MRLQGNLATHHFPQAMQTTKRDERKLPLDYFSQQQPHDEPYRQQPQVQARHLHLYRRYDTAAPPIPSKQHKRSASSTTTSLLAHCTAEAPLNDSQVFALTNVVGSLKELVLLALAAKNGDGDSLLRLQNALGDGQAVDGVVDFFSDEFEIG